MKKMAFILFFSIVFILYGLINYYIYHRVVSLTGHWHKLFSVFFWIWVMMYPCGRIIEKQNASLLSDVMIWLGAFWLAIMLYAFLLVFVADIISLLAYIIPSLRNLFGVLSPQLKFLIGSLLIWVSVIGGYINANHPRARYFELSAPIKEKMRITFLSDIHLGTSARKYKISRIKQLVEESRPNILIYGGDILDEDVGPVTRNKIGFDLLSLKAPLGVYAVTGNHEYIGGASQAIAFLQSFNIKILQDEWLIIDSTLILAGRKDKDGVRFGGKERQSLKDLLQNIPRDLPIILVDHQPFEIEEKNREHIFLNLSGHTHHGQLWPLQYITKGIYKKSFGWMERSHSRFYVSCGAGTWGPPIRTSSRPEIIVIDLVPQDK